MAMIRLGSTSIQFEALLRAGRGELYSMELQTCVRTETGLKIRTVKMSNVLTFTCICLKCGSKFASEAALKTHSMTAHQSSGDITSNNESSLVNLMWSNTRETTGNKNVSSVSNPANFVEQETPTSADVLLDITWESGSITETRAETGNIGGRADSNMEGVIGNLNERAFGMCEDGTTSPSASTIDGNEADVGCDAHVITDDEADETPANNSGADVGFIGATASAHDNENCEALSNKDGAVLRNDGDFGHDVRCSDEAFDHDRKDGCRKSDGRVDDKQRVTVIMPNMTNVEEKPNVTEPEGGKDPDSESTKRRRRRRQHKSRNHKTDQSCRQGRAAVRNKAVGTGKRRVATPLTSDTSPQGGEPEPYVCSVCGRLYRFEHTLVVHMRSHTGEKPYMCCVCGKTFAQKGNMAIHMRVHTGEKPYVCIDCGKAFTDKSGLKAHTVVVHGHDGGEAVAPAICSYCGQSFKLRRYMVKHERISHHEDYVKPSCEICGSVQRTNWALKIHMMKHAGDKPYSCTTCGQGFYHACQLAEHSTSHTGEKPFACSQCGQTFSRRRYLSRHIRVQHKI